MKQTKKIIAIGLSLGMVLISIPVSASDYITADQWSEDVEGISESSEGTENEALEDISEPAEEIGSLAAERCLQLLMIGRNMNQIVAGEAT